MILYLVKICLFFLERKVIFFINFFFEIFMFMRLVVKVKMWLVRLVMFFNFFVIFSDVFLIKFFIWSVFVLMLNVWMCFISWCYLVVICKVLNLVMMFILVYVVLILLEIFKVCNCLVILKIFVVIFWVIICIFLIERFIILLGCIFRSFCKVLFRIIIELL